MSPSSRKGSQADVPAHRGRRLAALNVLRVKSEVLLGQRGELIIEHSGKEYRLRVTKTGKLILTA